MRRRSTFVQDGELDFNPETIRITKDRFFVPEIKAAREEQLKYSFNELPEELQQVLINTHELHVRWTPEHRVEPVAPYLSRSTPGLRVLYSPQTGGHDDLLCPMLQRVFSQELKCHSPNTTFTRPDVVESEFNTTPALEYYSILPHLDHFVKYLQRTICPHSSLDCIHSTSLLSFTDSLDISWDTITSTLTISTLWNKPPASLIDPSSAHKTTNAWSISIDNPPQSSRVEVGILSSTISPSDTTELTLSGFLTVLGTDTSPKPTRFSIPSRHHTLQPQQAYTAHITQPQGLHPTLKITFPAPSTLQPPRSGCNLQAHLTLPSHTFVDPYALKPLDPSFVSTYHIQQIHSHSGHLDLEAPDYLPNSPWGSSLLITPQLPPTNHPTNQPWEVTLPLHLRYLPPSTSPTTTVTLPYPLLYYACPSSEPEHPYTTSPFDRPHLGYTALYPSHSTSYHHLTPQSSDTTTTTTSSSFLNDLSLSLQVPVYDTTSTTPLTVEIVTLLTILAGFVWVVRQMWPALAKEVKEWVPETVETKEPMREEWAEPVKGGPVRKRRG